MPNGPSLARLAAIVALAAAAPASAAPPTPRDAVVDVLHGVRAPDPYRWPENLGAGDERAIAGPTPPAWLSRIVTEQVWFRSKDGTRVPMFLAHLGPIRRDADNRVLLRGYGGFGWAQTPEFTPEEAAWIENGGVFALANIRGGGEFGVARWWRDVYGSVSDPAQFRTLLAYSPYRRVATGTRYPAVMRVTGAEDTRVSPAHALKMTAALQHASRSGRPVLLLYDSHSGHSGEMPAAAAIDQTAHELAFLLWRTGGRPGAGGAGG